MESRCRDSKVSMVITLRTFVYDIELKLHIDFDIKSDFLICAIYLFPGFIISFLTEINPCIFSDMGSPCCVACPAGWIYLPGNRPGPRVGRPECV